MPGFTINTKYRFVKGQNYSSVKSSSYINYIFLFFLNAILTGYYLKWNY